MAKRVSGSCEQVFDIPAKEPQSDDQSVWGLSVWRNPLRPLGAALTVYIRHCRDCQKQSASSFGMSMAVRREGFRIVQGEPALWYRTAASGRLVACAFCKSCGMYPLDPFIRFSSPFGGNSTRAMVPSLYGWRMVPSTTDVSGKRRQLSRRP
jgi:Glutathione-dependent formaldehyde-activating enzyme